MSKPTSTKAAHNEDAPHTTPFPPGGVLIYSHCERCATRHAVTDLFPIVGEGYCCATCTEQLIDQDGL